MILGIDYGRVKVGLAIAETSLASPLEVLRVNSLEDAVKKVSLVVEREKVEKIIVGISENEMAKEQKEFVQKLSENVSVLILVWDEGLSTFDAQQMSIASGMKRTKRKKMEDAFAASVVLQSWLDTNFQNG